MMALRRKLPITTTSIAVVTSAVFLLWIFVGFIRETNNDVGYLRDKDGDLVLLPQKIDLSTLKSSQLSTLYHRYINSLQVACKSIIRLGNQGDGGWDVCDDEAFRPSLRNCIVYSFGIDNDFSFDNAVAQRYGCLIYAYDPSMEDTGRNYGDNIHFFSFGLGERQQVLREEGKVWHLNTFEYFRQSQGHMKKPIDILKLDIEDWEWTVIPQMIISGMLQSVNQLVIELHLSIIRTDPGPVKYKIAVQVLMDLYKAGFRIFWTRRNLHCKFYSFETKLYRTGCHEVSFVRIKK